jgi:O-antigen/teichoic acid export membrane protein
VRKFYIAFCAPLVVYTAASFAYDFFDRWFLQTVAGSVQQGFFGLAMQWSALSLFFTTSLLNILWRELAVALAGGNMDRVRELYVRSSSLLYFCAAVIGTYIAVSAPELVTRLAGPQYQGAITVLVLMAFLPLHQTLGQINGTFYFATERVRVYRNLGIMSMLLGMGVSYVFLAPATLPIPGLHLGAVGLALKLVAASLIMANVFIVHNSRYLGIAYWPQLRRQGVALVLTCAIAAIARLLVTALPITNVWLRLGLVGIVYGALLVGVIFRFPDAAGLRNRDLALAASWFSAIARGGRRS